MRVGRMELSPRMLLATGVALGSLMLTGCGDFDEPGPSDPPGEGSFENGEFVKPVSSGDATDHIRIYCEEGDLFKRHDDKGEQDSLYRYVDHPACEDGQLTPEDTFSPDVFENEYLTEAYSQLG